ncbi:hypothetical protein ACW95P_02510 [Candidatus Mycoplasma pogonae]
MDLNSKIQEKKKLMELQYKKIKLFRDEMKPEVLAFKKNFDNKKFDKLAFEKIWKKFLNLETLIAKFNTDIQVIFEKTDLNLMEHKQIILNLDKVKNLIDKKYKKYQTYHKFIDIKVATVENQNKQFREMIKTQDFYQVNKFLKQFKAEVYELYNMVNDFIELELEVRSLLPQKIDLDIYNYEKYKKNYNVFTNKNVSDIYQHVKLQQNKILDSFENGDFATTKNLIIETYIELKQIKNHIKQEIKYTKFWFENKFLIQNTYGEVEKIMSLFLKDLEKWKKDFFIRTTINLFKHEKNIKNIFDSIIASKDIHEKQEEKKDLILAYKDVIYKMQLFTNTINKINTEIYNLEKEKEYYLKLFSQMEFDFLELKEIIEDENIILISTEKELIASIEKQQFFLANKITDIERDFDNQKDLIKLMQKDFIKLVKSLAPKILLNKIIKNIFMRLNAQKFNNKELNSNLNLLEKKVIDGQYQNGLDEFIIYLKKRN